MSFIDEGIAARTKANERAEMIRQRGPEIYQTLWSHVARYAEEARTKGFNLFIEGSAYDRVVGIHVIREGAMMSDREQFNLTLDKDQIQAHGDRGVNFTFSLDLCEDGIVYLKNSEGHVVTMDEAAISILEPFLFHESK